MSDWNCSKCTFINRFDNIHCEMCNFKYTRRLSNMNYNTYKTYYRRISIDDSVILDDLIKDLNTAKSIKDDIIKQLKLNEKFVDPDFPPCTFSISKCQAYHKPTDISAERRNKLHNSLKEVVQWLRPEILRGDEYSDSSLAWCVLRNPSSEDIVQGRLGNCWLLTGLVLTADRQDLLDRILITKDIDPYGIYQVRLCKDGLWQVVTIDDYFPANQFNNLIYSRANRKQLWVSIIEKAAAKLYGCYEALTSGYCADGLSALIGSPCETIRIMDIFSTESSLASRCSSSTTERSVGPVENISYESVEDQDRDNIDSAWAKLLSARQANFVMCASCGCRDENEQDAKRLHKLGLTNLHAYAILDAFDYNDIRLVRLKNPWSRFTWKGNWSDDDEINWSRLPSSIREKSQPIGVSGESCGVFWISWDDVLRYFLTIDICRIYDCYKSGPCYELRLASHLPWPVWIDWMNNYQHCNGQNCDSAKYHSSTDTLSCSRPVTPTGYRMEHEESQITAKSSIQYNDEWSDKLPDLEQDSNTCAVLDVHETSHVQIVLWQSNSRENDAEVQLDIQLIICYGYQQHPVGQIIANSTRTTSSYVVCDVVLDPGIYSIFYLSFHCWRSTVILDEITLKDSTQQVLPCLDFPDPPKINQSQYKCTLSVHSSKPVKLKRAVLTPSMIPEVLIELAVAKGRKQLFGKIKVYSLMNTFGGMLLVVVNPYESNQSVRCTSDCSGSHNIINSRSNHLEVIEDVIHAGYCQILTLLTQCDACSSYTIQHKYTATMTPSPTSPTTSRCPPGLEHRYPVLIDAPDRDHWPPIQLVLHQPWSIKYTSLINNHD